MRVLYLPCLFCPLQIEEENAALLAALTDSLDGIVEDGVGGLSVFPSLGEDPDDEEEEAEEEDDLPLDSEPFPGSLSPETEDTSLVRTLPSCLRWIWMGL